MTEAIVQLKNIADELEKLSISCSTIDNMEKAMYLCEINEQLQLAQHHLHFAINKLIVYHCFDKKTEVKK